jgi:hypothetical protein
MTPIGSKITASKGTAGFRSPGFNPGKRPMKRSTLKGCKLTWINPTHLAPQNKCQQSLAYKSIASFLFMVD